MFDDTTQQDPVEQVMEGFQQEQPVQEQSENQDQQQQTLSDTAKQQVAKSKEENMARLRMAKEQAERERDELVRILRESQVKQQQEQPQEDDDFSLKDDELAEGKHLTKMARKMKRLEEEVKAYQAKSYEYATEARIKSTYPDFDKVVNTETIAQFKEIYPELAETINSTPDLYNKAISAYTMIKKMGVYQGDEVMEEKARVAKNAAKPKTMATLSPQQGDSPLGRANAFANGLTDELKKQLWSEMQEAAKKY